MRHVWQSRPANDRLGCDAQFERDLFFRDPTFFHPVLKLLPTHKTYCTHFYINYQYKNNGYLMNVDAEMYKILNLLSKNIEIQLLTRKMSQSELARRVGVKPSTISQIVSKTNKNPSFQLVLSIARALEFSVGNLIGESTEPDHSLSECYRRIGEVLEEMDKDPEKG